MIPVLVALLQLGVPTIVSTLFMDTEVRVYWDVELDGRPETQEWVVNAVGPGPLQGMMRNAQLPGANGGLCVGPWYDPRPTALRGVPLEARLERIGGITHVTGDGPGLTFAEPLLPPTVCE